MADGIIGFYEADVLFLYQSKPDKYELDTDYFEGMLRTTGPYYSELESSGKQAESIRIRFGYHSKKDGTLCIAVYLPDLAEFCQQFLPAMCNQQVDHRGCGYSRVSSISDEDRSVQ